MYITMDIVKRISDFLGIMDWSPYHLSLESGIPKTIIYRILSHEVSPNFEQIEQLCSAFKVTAEEFFSDSLTPSVEEVKFLHIYRSLSKESKKMLIYLMENMK